MLADYGHSDAVWQADLKASVTCNKHVLLHVWVVSGMALRTLASTPLCQLFRAGFGQGAEGDWAPLHVTLVLPPSSPSMASQLSQRHKKDNWPRLLET